MKVYGRDILAPNIEYLSDVTSTIQSQLDSKQPNIIGAASTVVTENLGISRAVISDINGTR